MSTVDPASSAAAGVAFHSGEAELNAVPASPGATITVRRNAAAGEVFFTVSGRIGRNDTARLSRHLHAELEADPTVVVVNLHGVECSEPGCGEVLTVARERARKAGIALHLLDPGGVTGLSGCLGTSARKVGDSSSLGSIAGDTNGVRD